MSLWLVWGQSTGIGSANSAVKGRAGVQVILVTLSSPDQSLIQVGLQNQHNGNTVDVADLVRFYCRGEEDF